MIELQIQYMKIPSSNLGEHVVYRNCLTFRTIFVHKMSFPCSAKRRASDKDLPVHIHVIFFYIFLCFALEQNFMPVVNSAKQN